MVQMELKASPRQSTQDRHLTRVSDRIAKHVLDYCRARYRHAPWQFYMAELADYVFEREPCAPDSPGRILRQLRQRGLVRYRVVNRAQSLYEILEVRS